MNNPKKLTALGTQDEDKQNKNRNTMCVGHLLQTTGGKDEPDIVFMPKSQRTSQFGKFPATTACSVVSGYYVSKKLYRD